MKFLGVICLRKMCALPEAMFDDMQACPTPKSTKEMQAFEGIWGFWRTFILHMASYHHPLYHLVGSTCEAGDQSSKQPLESKKTNETD